MCKFESKSQESKPDTVPTGIENKLWHVHTINNEATTILERSQLCENSQTRKSLNRTKYEKHFGETYFISSMLWKQGLKNRQLVFQVKGYDQKNSYKNKFGTITKIIV